MELGLPEEVATNYREFMKRLAEWRSLCDRKFYSLTLSGVSEWMLKYAKKEQAIRAIQATYDVLSRLSGTIRRAFAVPAAGQQRADAGRADADDDAQFERAGVGPRLDRAQRRDDRSGREIDGTRRAAAVLCRDDARARDADDLRYLARISPRASWLRRSFSRFLRLRDNHLPALGASAPPFRSV